MNIKDNDLLSWQIRSFILYEYLSNTVDDEISNIADWLELCSGINSIDVTTAKFDDALYLCKTASVLEDNRSKLLSIFVQKLVEFHFAWGSLESLILKLIPAKKISEYGKINSLCGYLLKNKSKLCLPRYYNEIFEKLTSILRANSYYKCDLVKIGLVNNDVYSYKNYVDIAGIGIYTVYKIRNKFAHGTMNIPLPKEFTSKPVNDLNLIELSTKIVLLTIQMLLASDLKKSDYILDDNFMLVNSAGKSLTRYILELHLIDNVNN